MVTIQPAVDGQYIFRYKIGNDSPYIVVFHFYWDVGKSFHVDLYVAAFTPSNAIPSEFVSQIGLPDLRRVMELTKRSVKIDDITILDRKNSIFQQRRVGWRLGMRNLCRVSDEEVDEHAKFIH